MKTYQVDLDYESFLFDPSYQENSPSSLKRRREFEYIFFLVNKENCCLKNCRNYSPDYLNKLKSLGFTLPILEPEATEYIKWWGHHHDLNLEKKLNSKLTSTEIGSKNGWGFFHGTLIHTPEEARAHISKYSQFKRWLIKNPFSFSGIGHYSFNDHELNELFFSRSPGPLLLEPYYERVFDIGTTFLIEHGQIKDWFMVENHISPHGAFRGGIGGKTKDDFKKYILQRYSFDLGELEKMTLEIANVYLGLGAEYNIQIDSFVYKEGKTLRLYPLVEVNYRKTMGLVIQSLAVKNKEFKISEWLILSSKESRSISLEDQYLLLSPEGNAFKSYLKGLLA